MNSLRPDPLRDDPDPFAVLNDSEHFARTQPTPPERKRRLPWRLLAFLGWLLIVYWRLAR